METSTPIEPMNDNENPISNFIDELNESDRDFHERAVRKARNILYGVGILVFISEMIPMFFSDTGFNWLILIVALVESGVFVGFALWTKRKAYSALTGGLIAFIAFLCFTLIVNTYNDGIVGAMKAIFSGIIIKVAILVTLVRALSNAKQLQAIQNRSAA